MIAHIDSTAANPIAVIGAGSWGTALAVLLARNGSAVRLWDNQPELLQALQQTRCNMRYGIDVTFPVSLTVHADFATLFTGVRDILIVVPSHAFPAVCQDIYKLCPHANIAWATKGVASQSGELLHTVVQAVFGSKVAMAMVSGPSFAREVALGLPTMVNIAGNCPIFINSMTARLQAHNFKVVPQTDLIGMQLCSVIKNVLAIAAGISDGLGHGANTRAALLAEGVRQAAELNRRLGGQDSTLLSLAGLGDLVLTCTDAQSRNRRFGLALGRGLAMDAAKAEIGQVVEGFDNAAQFYQLASQYRISMPLFAVIYRILYEHWPAEALVSVLFS